MLTQSALADASAGLSQDSELDGGLSPALAWNTPTTSIWRWTVAVKNDKQYEALRDKGMSKERAAKIANSPDASKHGGEKSHSGSGNRSQGGTTAQHKAAGRKGGKAAHRG